MRVPQRKSITPRPLLLQEKSWIREIMHCNSRWADADLGNAQVVAQCDCGTANCKTIYLHSAEPQNPSLTGTKGYIGRIEIRTADDFGITVTLDQKDGHLSELYVLFLDLQQPGDRQPPDKWEEKAHIVTPM
jgi:hypothetical protein